MNEPEAVSYEDRRASRPVFISYATVDRKHALAVCTAIERLGPGCWISTRDVAPGENYQEAIVRAIREARAIALVFSNAANHSDEIKKELSLASRFHVPVITLRIENVDPSDAFAYELSTRQWIDAFNGWEKSIDVLVGRIEQLSGAKHIDATARVTTRRLSHSSRHPVGLTVALGLLLLLISAGGWWMLRPPSAPVHSMMVRLADFDLSSAGLPVGMREAVSAEITAAFNEDGVIGVSAAKAPPPGSTPAYVLSGTIHRLGQTIRVITRLSNERSGVVLWSGSTDYPADRVSKIPRKIAVDAGIVIRCGLSGASTYRKSLPDPVLKDYMQYCQESWSYGGTKTLLPAQRVVAAAPDFSWGWSAVQTGYMQASFYEQNPKRAEDLRAAGLKAADKALALDRANSEALDRKAYLIDPHDWVGQEKLYKASIAAKPLDCGCQHYGYGLMLIKVGRLADAVEQQRAATDMLALWPDSQVALADALTTKNRIDEAKSHYVTATDLSNDQSFGPWLAATRGMETSDYTAAVAALRNPRIQMPEHTRAALLLGYRALATHDSQARRAAIQALLALPQDAQIGGATMLAALGAYHEALMIARQSPWLFWRRSMRGILSDPSFADIAKDLGLLSYWKASHTRPDVCRMQSAPSFCRMI